MNCKILITYIKHLFNIDIILYYQFFILYKKNRYNTILLFVYFL